VSSVRSYEWYDPQPIADAARRLDGLSFLRAMADGTLPPPPIVSTMGLTLLEVDAGRVVFSIEPGGFHYNPIGSVHGGVYATILDSATGCAVHTTLPAGVAYTSLDLSVKFLRAATTDSGTLRCEGTVVQAGRRTALATAHLTGPGGRLYATATSSCLIIRPEG
jgi:uncharacterized protein (TIGR00369 family)